MWSGMEQCEIQTKSRLRLTLALTLFPTNVTALVLGELPPLSLFHWQLRITLLKRAVVGTCLIKDLAVSQVCKKHLVDVRIIHHQQLHCNYFVFSCSLHHLCKCPLSTLSQDMRFSKHTGCTSIMILFVDKKSSQ